MEYTKFLIQEILSSKRDQSQSFQLDNLDYVTFDLYEDGDTSLINEHGTELDLEDLSINELKTLNLLLGNPPKFDYVILSEDNQWLSFGKKETSEEAKVNNLIKLFGKDFDLEPRYVIESCNESFMTGAKWQQEQEQDNENSWFNQYQEVEDYIIKRIGDKFLEATPEKYNTASEATIALLEDTWEQNKKLYSEEEVLKIIDLLFHKYASSFRVDAKEDFLLSKKK